MFSKLIKRLLTAHNKKIAFIDGDQAIDKALAAYDKYVANTGTETHFIRLAPPPHHNEPKVLKKLLQERNNINKMYVEGTAGKEVVDKFIAGYIQRAVAEGYSEITVISNDYDFIDIFKMAAQINERAQEVTFRIISPSAKGRLAEMPATVSNINVVRC